jgi:multiple sugar transport system permease protein
MHAGETRFAVLLTLPGLLVLLLTTTIPLIYLIWSSFQTINLSMPFLDGFAGVDNYVQMWGDTRYWHALALTGIYTTTSVSLQIIIGLGLALLVIQIPAGQWIFRIAAILPIVLAPVVVGLFWRTLMLAPNFGLVDYLIQRLGMEQVNWLGAPVPALISVIVIHSWQWTPFAFLVLLASLASLPPDVYEAARIDRANAFRRFWHITLPLLRPAIVIVIIMRAMISLAAFAAIFAATGGGPGTATEILNLYAFKTSFVELNFGYGSTLAVSLLVITMAVSGVLFYLRTARNRGSLT